jgi:hypothetical protein
MTSPGDLMHEDRVYEKYRDLFADRELREARKTGLIRWYDLRKGPHYTEAQLMEYLRSKERGPCLPGGKVEETGVELTGSSRSGRTGLGSRRRPTSSSIIGMTPQLEERAAELLESET